MSFFSKHEQMFLHGYAVRVIRAPIFRSSGF